MGVDGIDVPYLSYDRLRELAEAFIQEHHPSREIPIPVEEIIDVRLHVNIVPTPGLTKVFADDEDDGIESFVTSSLTDIYVDEDAYTRQTNRYRFTIAHELAHIHLHDRVFRTLEVHSIAEWRETVKSIPRKQYAWLEWQAYSFAGHLLVPTTELEAHLSKCIEMIEGAGMSSDDEAVRPSIEKNLGDTFKVSSIVIHKRVERENLWP
ncbi:hypothetical protein LCGC14_2212970 [marine sediment metagenome]|uniref:IrrE N-terminal-like domain-containing protein n=1 Tax=marine sediment metagenome TaxID=412755 RepID=A0A0F9E0P9_9ZZZZ